MYLYFLFIFQFRYENNAYLSSFSIFFLNRIVWSFSAGFMSFGHPPKNKFVDQIFFLAHFLFWANMVCHHVPYANIFCSPRPFAKHFVIIPSAWFIPWLTKSARVVLICNMNTLRNFFSFGVVRNLQHKNTAWWTNCLKLVSGLDNFILRDAWPHFPKRLQHIESCAPQGSWGCKNLNQSSSLFFKQLTSEIIIRPHFFHQLSCI